MSNIFGLFSTTKMFIHFWGLRRLSTKPCRQWQSGCKKEMHTVMCKILMFTPGSWYDRRHTLSTFAIHLNSSFLGLPARYIISIVTPLAQLFMGMCEG